MTSKQHQRVLEIYKTWSESQERIGRKCDLRVEYAPNYEDLVVSFYANPIDVCDSPKHVLFYVTPRQAMFQIKTNKKDKTVRKYFTNIFAV